MTQISQKKKKVEARNRAVADGGVANEVALIGWVSGGVFAAVAAAGFLVAAVGGE
jgi:hypothetical protein